jgi:hypothetical protein
VEDLEGFAGRVAYLRWLLSRGRIAPLTDKALADWLGVTEKWFGKWKTKRRAPEGRTESLAIDAALSRLGTSTHWLYDAKEDPPRPELWAVWRESEEMPETITIDGTTYRDVTEDVGGHDARVAEGAKLARDAAAKKKSAEERRRNGG